MRVNTVVQYNISAINRKYNFNNEKAVNNNLTGSNTQLIDKNYASLAIKKVNPAFKSNNDIDTGDKISALLNELNPDELIIVSKNKKQAQKDINENINAVNGIFNKVYFVENKNMSGSMLFNKIGKEIKFTNLERKTVDIDESYDSNFEVFHTDSVILTKTAKINNGLETISLRKYPTQEAINSKKTYAEEIELDEKRLKEVRNLTSKLVSDTINNEKSNEINNKENFMTFDKIGGQHIAKKELKKSIIYPIKYPFLQSRGMGINKNAILYGPPGTGKTMLGLALENEAGVPFFQVQGSELDSKYVGESEQHWRELAEKAIKAQPSIVFIDEMDAIGKKRGGQDVYGDKVLNTILAILSDIEKKNYQVYMVGATNNIKSLDPALLRPGRFGLQIPVFRPTKKDLDEILNISIKNQILDKNVNKKALINEMYNSGLTGSDVKYLVRLARDNSFERLGHFDMMDKGTYTESDMNSAKITNDDFINAFETIINSKR